MPKKKLIVTGASGFLGWNLCQIAANEWDVYGLVHSNPAKIDGVEILQVDITKARSIGYNPLPIRDELKRLCL